jgi:hypothetical protein
VSKPFVVVGIDLAGSRRRPTGVCLLRGLRAHTHIAFSDEDILNLVHQAQPDLVPIDAPLSLPKGRRTIHDRSGEHFRDCDRELQRRRIGIGVGVELPFPLLLAPPAFRRPFHFAAGLALLDGLAAVVLLLPARPARAPPWRARAG